MKAIYKCVLLLLLFSFTSRLCFAVNEWNCSAESSCSQSISDNKWTCYFYNCTAKPTELINITQIQNCTIVNATNTTQIVNYTCNNTEIVRNLSDSVCDLLSNLSGQIKESYNYTDKYSNVYTKWEMCQSAYSELLNDSTIEKNQMSESCRINQTVLLANITESNDIIEQKDKEKTTYAFGGFIVGVVLLWYFKVRKPEASYTGISPIPNPEQSFSQSAIDDDIRKEKQRQKDREENLDFLKKYIDENIKGKKKGD